MFRFFRKSMALLAFSYLLVSLFLCFLHPRFKVLSEQTKYELISLGYPAYTVEDFCETVCFHFFCSRFSKFYSYILNLFLSE